MDSLPRIQFLRSKAIKLTVGFRETSDYYQLLKNLKSQSEKIEFEVSSKREERPILVFLIRITFRATFAGPNLPFNFLLKSREKFS